MRHRIYDVLLGVVLAFAAPSISAFAFEPLVINAQGTQPRSALINRPSTQIALPTIILLHGHPGSAQQLSTGVGGQLAQLGDQKGFVIVLPDAINGRWNLQLSKISSGKTLLPLAPDDVAFLKTLVGELVQLGVSDPKRVYLAGISWGGYMTLRMTCDAASMFAAIGLIITGMPTPMGEDCHPSEPMPVVMMLATGDPRVPWKGRPKTPNNKFGLWPQEQLIAWFLQLDGCAAAAKRSASIAPKVELVLWTKCVKGEPVVLYRVNQNAHTLFPNPPIPETLWEFFRDKTR